MNKITLNLKSDELDLSPKHILIIITKDIFLYHFLNLIFIIFILYLILLNFTFIFTILFDFSF